MKPDVLFSVSETEVLSVEPAQHAVNQTASSVCDNTDLSSPKELIVLYALQNPQKIYAETLLLWNALLLTCIEWEGAPIDHPHALLDETKGVLLSAILQLGLLREKARIERQYALIVLSPLTALEQANHRALDAFHLDNIRSALVETNWMRLYLLRLDRLASVIPAVAHSSKLSEILKTANSVLHPIFNILSWLYYLPRLMINLTMLFKHTVPGSWMSASEKTLPFSLRLKAQWDRRWFELLNDSVWCAVGLTTCFLLTGPQAMLLIVALYVFDVINISAKAYIEVRRYNKMITTIETEIDTLLCEQIKALDGNTDQHALSGLQEQIACKIHMIQNLRTLKKQHYQSLGLSVATAVGLLVGMVLFIPALAVCPIVPLIGAVIVIATCIAYIALKKAILKTPESRIQTKLNRHHLFKQPLVEKNTHTTTDTHAAPDSTHALALRCVSSG